MALTEKIKRKLITLGANSLKDTDALERRTIPIAEQIKTPVVTLCQQVSAGGDYDPALRMQNNVFTFYSPSGGTGVTTFVSNLAHTITHSNKTVALVDFDLYYPSQYRFWGCPAEKIKTVVSRFLVPSLPVAEFSNPTSNKFISLFCAAPSDSISKLCSFDIHNINKFIKDTSQVYDFVLIDLRGNLNCEWVMSAIDKSDKVFSFARPVVQDLERVYKDTLILESTKITGKTKYVIQSQIKTVAYTASDLKKYNLELVADLPYSRRIDEIGNNLSLVTRDDRGTTSHARQYIKICEEIATTLLNGG